MSFVRYVKLRVPACNAKPGPSLGQALGPLGLNMAEFTKQFNDRTRDIYEPDVPLIVNLTALSDRSFTFVIRSPPTTYLLKRYVGLKGKPGDESFKGPKETDPEVPYGYITPEAIYEIAKIKHQDDHMNHLPLERIARSIIGTCKTMGIHVREANDTIENVE